MCFVDDVIQQMGVTRDYVAYPGTCVPHDPHGDLTPLSDVPDLGWTKSGPITYHPTHADRWESGQSAHWHWYHHVLSG
jgi:hypothetical protein